MAPKKPPAAEDVETELPHKPNETYMERLIRSIVTMQTIMEQMFDHTVDITPEQLRHITEMYLAQMHLKRVTPEFYMERMVNACQMMRLAIRIEEEGKLRTIEGLSDAARATLDSAVELSCHEINALRQKMRKDVLELGQIPLPDRLSH